MNYRRMNRMLVGAAVTLVGVVLLVNQEAPELPPEQAPEDGGGASVASDSSSPTSAPGAVAYGSDDAVVAACKEFVKGGTTESEAAAVGLVLEKIGVQRYSFLSVGCTVHQILPFSVPDRWASDLVNQTLRGGEHTRSAVRQELARVARQPGKEKEIAIFAALFPDDDMANVAYDDSIIAMAALAQMIVATAELPSDELDEAVYVIFEDLDGRFFDNYDLLDNKHVEDNDNLMLACAARLALKGNAAHDAAFLKFAVNRAPESKYYRGPLEALIAKLQGP